MPDKPLISVTSLSVALKTKRRYGAVVTIEDPGLRRGLRFHRRDHPDHLVLKFEDVDHRAEGVALPDPRHVEAAIGFGRANAGKKILVHCKAGVARSTAIALALIADTVDDDDEAVRQLLEIRPVAIPNLLVLAMADEALGRNGRLVAAWEKVEGSSPEYAANRRAKRDLLARNPSLYARPITFEASAFRYLPGSLDRVPASEGNRWLPELDSVLLGAG